jgi:hypothetical protein
LLKLTTILLRCIPAFFRSPSRQSIVELGLRFQLRRRGRAVRITPADQSRNVSIILSTHAAPAPELNGAIRVFMSRDRVVGFGRELVGPRRRSVSRTIGSIVRLCKRVVFAVGLS